MSTKILIVYGHHRRESYCYDHVKAYRKGAEESGAEVQEIIMSDLEMPYFLDDHILKSGNFADDVYKSQRQIAWADHLVFVFPLWWYNMPAKLKSFIEQVFTSGFAFKYKDSSKHVQWDKYLTGKTARIITTMDSPVWYYKRILNEPASRSLRMSLNFCGVKPVKKTYYGSVKMSDEKDRKKWLKCSYELGKALR
jgi:putative NADPH-quinone reductase